MGAKDTVVARQVFLVGIAAIYACAFLSLYIQLPGLYGANGIIPVKAKLDTAAGPGQWQQQLTASLNMLWLHEPLGLHVDSMMDLVAIFAVVLASLAVMFHQLRTSAVFGLLWIAYYSLHAVGETFLYFQWDSLLLEVGFLAILVAPTFVSTRRSPNVPGACAFYLVKWLFFRLMYLSGVVKLTSGCPTWWGLTAMLWHYESQCIPQPLAWYAHALPDWLQALSVVAVFIIEIGYPFGFYAPSRAVRNIAAWAQVFLMALILVTGNYNFFNILTALLAVSVLDDRDLRWCLPSFFYDYHAPVSSKKEGMNDSVAAASEKKKKEAGATSWLMAGIRAAWEPAWVLALVGLTLYSCIIHFNVKVTIAGSDDDASSLASILQELAGDFSRMLDVQITSQVLFTRAQFQVFVTQSLYAAVAVGTLGGLIYIGSIIVSAIRTRAISLSCMLMTVAKLAVIAAIFAASCETLRWNDPKSALSELPHWHKVVEIEQAVHKYSIANSYGLFRRMTGVGGRPELTVEGSRDNVTWHEYNFKYKPGNLSFAPPINVPHQPRLDWQMWFAALGTVGHNVWLQHFAIRLLEGKQEVLDLLAKEQPLDFAIVPPKYLRIKAWTYHFTSKSSRGKAEAEVAALARDGDWWWREQRSGLYMVEIDSERFKDAFEYVRKQVMNGQTSVDPIDEDVCRKRFLCRLPLQLRKMARLVPDHVMFISLLLAQLVASVLMSKSRRS